MSEGLSASQREFFALELSGRADGYLTALDDVIIGLREVGLITTSYAGDGFVIARAVPVPAPVLQRCFRKGRWIQQHRTAQGQWIPSPKSEVRP